MAPDRHLGAVVSRSSRSMRGTKGAKAGNALETVLLCQRRAVRLVLMMLRRSSTLLRWPRPLCAGSAAIALLSRAAAGRWTHAACCSIVETVYQQAGCLMPLVLETVYQFLAVPDGCRQHFGCECPWVLAGCSD